MYAKNVYHMDQNIGKVNCGCSHFLASKSSFAQICHKVSPKTRCMIDCNQIFVERSKSLHA